VRTASGNFLTWLNLSLIPISACGWNETTDRSATLQIAGESYSVTQQAARISTNRKVK